MNMFLITLTAIGSIILIFILILIVIAKYSFDDKDPDLCWYDNYAAPSKDYYGNYLPVYSNGCKHVNKTDIVVWVTVTCETIQTVCDDCGAVLNIRTDC